MPGMPAFWASGLTWGRALARGIAAVVMRIMTTHSLHLKQAFVPPVCGKLGRKTTFLFARLCHLASPAFQVGSNRTLETYMKQKNDDDSDVANHRATSVVLIIITKTRTNAPFPCASSLEKGVGGCICICIVFICTDMYIMRIIYIYIYVPIWRRVPCCSPSPRWCGSPRSPAPGPRPWHPHSLPTLNLHPDTPAHPAPPKLTLTKP